jgi:L-iditol 2-dehydrogenase
VMPFVLPGVVRIPRGNSFIEGAMLEPVNTVLKGVLRLNLLKGDRVLVIGQGPIGLMFTRLLALRGIRVVATDLWPERLKLASAYGAEQVLNAAQSHHPLKISKAAEGCGFDAAVVTVPSDDALYSAQEFVRGAGQILLFANTRRGELSKLDLSSVCVDEKDLLGSYSSDIDLQKSVAKLVFSRKMDVRPLVSHQIPLEEAVRAIQLAARPEPGSAKIIVSPCLAP